MKKFEQKIISEDVFTQTIKDKLLDGEMWIYSPQKYPGYAFSSLGRSYSLKHNKFIKPYKTPYKSNHLYDKVKLFNGAIYKTYILHRVIAELFCDKSSPECTQVHHINGVCTDNRLKNLMWVSPHQHKLIHAEMRKGSKKEKSA